MVEPAVAVEPAVEVVEVGLPLAALGLSGVGEAGAPCASSPETAWLIPLDCTLSVCLSLLSVL